MKIEKNTKHTVIVISAAAGSLLALGAIAVNNGYVATSFFLGTSAAELGVLSVLAFVIAVLVYLA